MHKTTVNLRPVVWLRLRNRAEREGVPVGTLINDLLERVLTPAEGDYPTSIGMGDSDVTDLGMNARKYLRADLG